ncbi:MAG: LytTR family transcriptional regulator DNA-binding domain-containing protein, partial [Rufibacter sp.]
LQKYKNLQASHLAADQIKHLLQSLAHTQEPKYKERFLAVVKHALVPVPTPEIALFQKDELIFLHTWDGQRLVAESHSLEEIEHVVDPKVYYRVNRQALVHINAIGKVENTYKGMCLTLKAPLHMELDLSRQKVTHFKKWLEG